jgi:hypothetical protein
MNFISILFLLLGSLLSTNSYGIIATSDCGQQLLFHQVSELIFGPEWTFTNSEMLEDTSYSYHGPAMINYYAYIKNKFQNHAAIQYIESTGSQVIISLHSGKKIFVGSDEGVLEVQVSPMSLNEWKQNQAFMQDIVFNSMKAVGLTPHEREGAGHVNIGFNYFLDRHGLAEKFIIDYLNHPGLGIVLNSLTANQEDARNPLEHMISRNEIKNVPNLKIKFLDSIQKLKFMPIMKIKKMDSNNILSYLFKKFVAIRLHGRINLQQSNVDLTHTSTRFEMRQIRPQTSMKDYILLLQLFELRIKYLEKITSEIRTDRIFTIGKNMDGWEALGQFADYVEEAGLNFKDYKYLLPKVWRELPVHKFIRGPSIKIMKKSGRCQALFN